jgi:hypothetical protein
LFVEECSEALIAPQSRSDAPNLKSKSRSAAGAILKTNRTNTTWVDKSTTKDGY